MCFDIFYRLIVLKKLTAFSSTVSYFFFSSYKHFYFYASCRSYDALRGNPHVLKLIPAVGIIAFAAWGLGPLMRMGRIVFLHVFILFSFYHDFT